jgi:hypothetical protein
LKKKKKRAHVLQQITTKVVVCKILRNERREQAAAGVMLLTLAQLQPTHQLRTRLCCRPAHSTFFSLFLSFLGAKPIGHSTDFAIFREFFSEFDLFWRAFFEFS